VKDKLSEHDIQRQILDWLKLKHIFHWRNNSGAMRSSHKGKSRFMRFGAKGSPDIFAVIGGQIFGIEVKRPGGKQSEDQRIFEAFLTRAGGRYLVVNSLEGLEEALPVVTVFS
jgi:hypothetical protein